MADASAFRKLEHREHVLMCPGMYIGSTTSETISTWTMGADTTSMERAESLAYSPGLFKIVDEILVNAVDHSVRTRQMRKTNDKVVVVKRIDVTLSKEVIEVSNDGDSIPVEQHSEHGSVWVPELIFGHLLTSANYDVESSSKTIGGQNGIGAKACNIFSKWMEIDVIDRANGKRYVQRFEDNMSNIVKPKITSAKAASTKPKTTVRFLPDYVRLGMATPEMSDDMYGLLVRRVYDLTAVTDPDVAVYLNGKRIDIKSFERYLDLYLGGGKSSGSPRVYERVADGWEVGAALNSTGCGLQQVSFVNGVATLRGGKHVDHVVGQMCKRLCEAAASKKGATTVLRPQFVRDNLIVFLRATVPAPAFDSQSKETLTTPASKFGQRIELSDGFIDRLFKLPGLVDRLLSLSGAAAERDAARKTDGSKKTTVSVPKLDDAEWAGTAKSESCTLILTEGDSAKASAVAGLSVVGRKQYGVFPLRGKVMNVCDIGVDKIAANAEISAIKKILGLQNGKEYISTSELRYGRVMLMTDADLDGSHIKGLVMNLFAQQWPSLLKIDGFITSMLTPIVKVWSPPNATTASEFYSNRDFEQWQEDAQKSRVRFRSKYYKGLGTSTAEEARDWFRKMRLVAYTWGDSQISSAEAFSKAFNKKRANDRKCWLQAYDPSAIIEYSAVGSGNVPYSDFIDRDLIHFSNYDVLRSIPSVVDGLKVSQRKAIFGCRKRNLVSGEMRVAQLAAYASEHSCFHHGEASMQGTIVCLAQDFVGCGNNLPLLEPIGQFGTRLNGGSDYASPRYIHTRLASVASRLIMKEDDAVLKYMADDGISIEPSHYVPILPMVLVNGAQGIGTGYSTMVPSYNPDTVMSAVRLWIREQRTEDGTEGQQEPWAELDWKPWYRGFGGVIDADASGKLRSRGLVSLSDKTRIRVTELPLGMWTEDFKDALEALVAGSPDIKSYSNESSESKVNFTVTFANAAAAAAWMTIAESGLTKFESSLKMVSSKGLATSNMHLFDPSGCIRKYETPNEIVKDFCTVRLATYVERRRFLISKCAEEVQLLDNRSRFIAEVISGSLKIGNRDDADLDEDLEARGFDRIDEKDTESDRQDKDVAGGGGYAYLLSMRLSSLTQKRRQQLEAQLAERRTQLAELESTTPLEMWSRDLESLEKALL